MTRLPQSNATLTEVLGEGYGFEWTRDETVGAAKWSGTSDAYLVERRERSQSGEATTVVTTRSLVVPTALGVAWRDGDVVRYSYAGATREDRVRGVEARHFPDAGIVETTRLTLEPV